VDAGAVNECKYTVESSGPTRAASRAAMCATGNIIKRKANDSTAKPLAALV